MEPIRVAICDDLPGEQDTLLDVLDRSPVETKSTLFGSGEELPETSAPHKSFCVNLAFVRASTGNIVAML